MISDRDRGRGRSWTTRSRRRVQRFGGRADPTTTLLVITVLGVVLSGIVAHVSTLAAVAYIPAIFVISWAGWVALMLSLNRTTYYYYFFFNRIAPVLVALGGLGYLSYRIFTYFEHFRAGTYLVFSRGADFLLYAFGFTLFTSLLIWASMRMRMLSGQQELSTKTEASMLLEYVTCLPHYSQFIDQGNHVFSLSFRVKPYIGHLRAAFVAIEKLDPRTESRTGIVWTSKILRPARPLGLGPDPSGEKRVFGPDSVDRWVITDAQEIYAFVKAWPAESEWFEPNSQFQAVVYLWHGGYIKAKTVLGPQQEAVGVGGQPGAPR